MMKRITYLLILNLILSISTIAQDDNDVLITIDNYQVTKDEFLRIYSKNKTNISTGEITSIDEYLKLFINFKLKVIEAEKLRLDTFPDFKNELNGYRNQLARPYLTDNETNEKLIQEAYDRLKTEVRASHILIGVKPEAGPEDTAYAYEKAVALRNRILSGEAFENVAKGSSDDPSVKYNGGDLGFFTAFQMVYPFESAVYKLKNDEVSMPVRTRFGYHVIKKTDSRVARGEVKVAHIMLLTPAGILPADEQKKKSQINDIYHRLKQGENFAVLAKEFSEDKGTAKNGGELPWFGAGRMVPEFEQAAFALKTNDELSQPVKTSFGWHILKRIDRKEIGSFSEMEAEIKYKVGKDERILLARKALIEKLKIEYNFKVVEENIPFYTDATDNKLYINQKYLNPESDFNEPLFSFYNQVVKEKEYVDYINKFKGKNNLTPEIYKSLFFEFIENKILETENSRLESKYPEFRYLINEYHDGMLLFELTDDMVWSKAVNDSAGLSDFYNQNKENYMSDEKFDGTVYYCSNENVYKKVSKTISKSTFGTKVTNDDLLNQFNTDSNIQLRIESKLFNKGENEYVDNKIWNGKNNIENGNLVLVKGEKIKKSYKPLDEIKGVVISDYQNFIEKEWIHSLHSKYSVSINNQVLSTIK
ncbi:MAG TPA: hypothetical protein DCQ24_15265 [Bacteroidales bacterium]|nr:hypothetical protein [Bacteroidales bacterium]